MGRVRDVRDVRDVCDVCDVCDEMCPTCHAHHFTLYTLHTSHGVTRATHVTRRVWGRASWGASIIRYTYVPHTFPTRSPHVPHTLHTGVGAPQSMAHGHRDGTRRLPRLLAAALRAVRPHARATDGRPVRNYALPRRVGRRTRCRSPAAAALGARGRTGTRASIFERVAAHCDRAATAAAGADRGGQRARLTRRRVARASPRPPRSKPRLPISNLAYRDRTPSRLTVYPPLPCRYSAVTRPLQARLFEDESQPALAACCFLAHGQVSLTLTLTRTRTRT